MNRNNHFKARKITKNHTLPSESMQVYLTRTTSPTICCFSSVKLTTIIFTYWIIFTIPSCLHFNFQIFFIQCALYSLFFCKRNFNFFFRFGGRGRYFSLICCLLLKIKLEHHTYLEIISNIPLHRLLIPMHSLEQEYQKVLKEQHH